MSLVRVENDERWVRVTLARADKRNAMNAQMIAELTEAFRNAATHSKATAVVLAGEGPSFCAGADLDYMKGMAKFNQSENVEDAEKLFDLFESIRTCPLPVIARIQGDVFGGGLGLVAAADDVVCDEAARFCFSEVKLGLVPAVISPFVLEKAVGGIAQSLMISGRVFGALEALRAGWVHHVVSANDLDASVKALEKSYAANGPSAMRVSKQLLSHRFEAMVKTHKSRVCETIARQRVSPEGQEGISAFLQKRPASWIQNR